MSSGGWKRWGVPAAVLVGVLAVLAGGVLLWQQFGASPSSSPSSSGGTHVLAAPAARELEADLSSGDAKRIRKVLAVPEGEKLDPSFLKELASLGHITIREDSAVRLDDTSARVFADVEQGPVKTWTLLLTQVGGRWRVASTIEGEHE